MGKAPTSFTPEFDLGIDGSKNDLEFRPVDKNDVATFEVGGFKLGMSPEEVERIAIARGLTTDVANVFKPFSSPTAYQTVDTFESSVARLVATRLGTTLPPRVRVIQKANLADSNGSKWTITFSPMERGAAVNAILYNTSARGNSVNTIMATLQDRYGPTPGKSTQWCGPGDPTCEYRPSLKANISADQISLIIQSGMMESLALQKKIESRAVKDAAAKAKKPAI